MTRSIKIDQLSESISAVPGSNVFVAVDQSANTIDSGVDYVQFFPDTTGSSSIVLPVAGKYLIQFNCSFWARRGTGTGVIKLVIDEGLSTEQTIGGDARHDWRNRGPSQNTWLSQMVAEANLTAGSHTVKGYFKTVAENGLSTVGTSVVACPNHSVFFTLVSGSGLGGIIPSVKTAGGPTTISGTWYPTWSPTEISALETLITVAEGERIEIDFSGFGQVETAPSGGYCQPRVRIYIDSSMLLEDVVTMRQQWDRCNLSMSALSDALTAGSHTIRVYAAKKDGTEPDWMAYSLRLTVSQYRGGQLPIKKDGTLIAATEQSLNFTGPGVQLSNNAGEVNIALASYPGSIKTEKVLSGNVTVSSTFTWGTNMYPTSITWQEIDAGGGDKASIDITTYEGEVVCISIDGYANPSSSGDHPFIVGIKIDGTVERLAQSHGPTQVDLPTQFSLDHVKQFTAGTHTLVFVASRPSPNQNVLVLGSTSAPLIGAKIKAVQYRGGYSFAENIPILEYNSASVVNVKAAPGCDSTLRAVLSDGKEYTYTGTLTIDLTVSGRGGIDTGSEASSTWYYAYLVPNSAGTGLSVLCSVTAPSTGPTGYSAWRYIGSFRNDGSSNILKFKQIGIDEFKYAGVQSVYSSGSAGYIEHESSYAEVSLTSYLPATAAAAVIGAYAKTVDETCAWEYYWSADQTNICFYQPFEKGVIETIGRITLSSSTSIYRRRVRTSGSSDLYWTALRVYSWTDGWLLRNKQMPLLPAIYAGHEEDVPPLNPSAYDDEFSGNTLQSKWTWGGAGAPSGGSGDTVESWSVDKGSLNMVIINDSSDWASGHRIYQAIPSGNFMLSAKFRHLTATAYNHAFLYLSDSGGTNAKVIRFGWNGGGYGVNCFSVSGGSAGSEVGGISYYSNECYLRLLFDVSAGTIKAYSSGDGKTWSYRTTWAAPLGFTVAHLGLGFLYWSGTGGQFAGSCEWFRVVQL